MQINLDTSSASSGELTALIALLHLLGGRLPDAVPVEVRLELPDLAAKKYLASLPTNPFDAAEALMRQESARVAAAPPPPVEEDVAVDPTTLDAEGIPWDARIHAGTKSQNKDGTWKKLRGVSEVIYGQVHAELQKKYAGNHGTGTEATGAVSPATDTAESQTAPSPENSTPAAPPPPVETGNVPVAPPPPTESAPTAVVSAPVENAPAAGRFADFPAFVQGINAIRAGGIPYLELNTYAQTVGVPSGFKDMKDHPDLWETFYSLAGGQ